MSKLLEPQESFPKEDWIQYARLLKLKKNTLHESCLAVDKRLERFETLQHRICKWAIESFGPLGQRLSGIFAHFMDEAKELEDALGTMGAPEELADCAILLFEMASFHGVDLIAEVEGKFAINQTREWGPIQEDGKIEHKK